jgi:hypothetical protein
MLLGPDWRAVKASAVNIVIPRNAFREKKKGNRELGAASAAEFIAGITTGEESLEKIPSASLRANSRIKQNFGAEGGI